MRSYNWIHGSSYIIQKIETVSARLQLFVPISAMSTKDCSKFLSDQIELCA